jgi:3-hydroxyacyl-CoA dehydrogenase/enoyl-CoA hydratase/3-hydroxybutyryl-CoA epimerase
MTFRHLRWDDSHPRWSTLWIDVADRKLNVLFEEVFDEVRTIAERLLDSDPSRPVMLRSGKPKGFVVGADLRRIGMLTSEDQVRAFLEHGQRVFDLWETLPQTTIACMSGAALGGGLEWTLACDVRLASRSPDTLLGLPEVNLGLSPAWGGTQRLVRLLGIERAVPMLMHGNSLGAESAFRTGLVDGLWTPDEDADRQLVAWLDASLASALQSRMPFDRSAALDAWLALDPDTIAVLEEGLPEDQRWKIETRRTIAHSIESGLRESMSAGQRAEREQFFEMMQRPEVQSAMQRFTKPAERTSS